MPLAETACELMFQVIADRAEKAAVIVTTNLPFSEWSHVIPEPAAVQGADRPADRPCAHHHHRHRFISVPSHHRATQGGKDVTVGPEQQP